MLYLIDGTGVGDPNEYLNDMGRGFCCNLDRRNCGASFWLRGPTLLGLETWDIAELMYAKVRADLDRDPQTKVVLAGHSRGGAAMIHLARKLQKDDIPVEAMVLFDAVRRALQKSLTDYGRQVLGSGIPEMMVLQGLGTAIEVVTDFFQVGNNPADVIPGNVRRALHVVRNETFSNYFLNTSEYRELVQVVQTKAVMAGRHVVPLRTGTEAQQSRLRSLLDMHAAMRDACRFEIKAMGGIGFGNTGLRAEAPCRLTVVPFMATHGAMGGAPLEVSKYIHEPRYAADIEAQEVVSMLKIQARVNAFLAEVNQEIHAGQQMMGAKLAYVPATQRAGQSLTARPGAR